MSAFFYSNPPRPRFEEKPRLLDPDAKNGFPGEAKLTKVVAGFPPPLDEEGTGRREKVWMHGLHINYEPRTANERGSESKRNDANDGDGLGLHRGAAAIGQSFETSRRKILGQPLMSSATGGFARANSMWV
jgi:hypothetical protein